MRKRDLLVGAACAIGSFGLILALSAPARLDAIEPLDALAVGSAAAEFIADGVAYSLTLAGQSDPSVPATVPPGSQPRLLLVARNTTDHAVEIRPTVSLQSQSLADRVSRVLKLPEEIWRHEQPALIAAGETKTFTLSPEGQLKPLTSVQGVLSVGDKKAVSLHFGVAGPDVTLQSASR